MDVLTAMDTLVTLTNTIANLVAQTSAVSSVVKQAQAEGRSTLTPTEWQTIQLADTAGRQVLLDAIAKALAAPKVE